MGFILTGDQHQAVDRKIGDLLRQLGQEGGYPHDPVRLLAALQAVGEGRFEAVGHAFPSHLHAADLIPKGWVVVEDVEPSDFKVEDLVFVGFLKDGETVVSGTVMRERAVALKANLGLSDAPRLLQDQTKISTERSGNNFIVLAGTVLRSPDGNLNVPVLNFGGEQWYLCWRWFEVDWDVDGRLPRSK